MKMLWLFSFSRFFHEQRSNEVSEVGIGPKFKDEQ
jgi:hypothetical protein